MITHYHYPYPNDRSSRARFRRFLQTSDLISRPAHTPGKDATALLATAFALGIVWGAAGMWVYTLYTR